MTTVISPRPEPAGSAFLELRDLKIHFPTDDGLVKSVDGLSFSLERGRPPVKRERVIPWVSASKRCSSR